VVKLVLAYNRVLIAAGPAQYDAWTPAQQKAVDDCVAAAKTFAGLLNAFKVSATWPRSVVEPPANRRRSSAT
jgi:hypothetical protein